MPLGSSSKLDQSNLSSIVEKAAAQQLVGFFGKVMIVEDTDKPYDDLVDITSTIIGSEVLLDLPSVTIFKRNSNIGNYSSICITVGGVYYPTDMYFSKFLDKFKDHSEYSFAFKVAIGKLDIPMSREELLHTSNNDLVLKEVVELACEDVDLYVKSLNIDLDVSLGDFYKNLADSSKHLKSPVEFKMEVSSDTFDVKDNDLKEYLKNFSYWGSNIQNNFLRSANICTTALNTLTDDSNTAIVVSSSSGNVLKYQNNFRPTFLDNASAPTFILTPSRLPTGVPRVMILNYIRDCFNVTDDIVLIQTPEDNHKDFHLLHDLFKAFYNFKVKKESTYLGVLDELALRAYIKQIKENLKLNKTPSTYTRSSIDYIPGLRVKSMSFFNLDCYGVVNKGFGDTKINALIDSLGKRVPFGPEYLDSTKQSNVFLTSSNELPITLCDDLLEDDLKDGVRNFNFSLPINSVAVKVSSGSLKAVVSRFSSDSNFKIYTEDNPYIAERPELNYVDNGQDIFKSTLRYLSYLLSDEMCPWHSTRVDFYNKVKEDLSSYVLDINIENSEFQRYFSEYILNTDVTHYADTSTNFKPSLKVYSEYSEKDCKNYAVELYNKLCEEEFKNISVNDLYDFANNRSRTTFEKALDSLFNKYKVNLNEI